MLRDLENQLDGIDVRYAELNDELHETARRWPWRQEVESQGRYFATIDDRREPTRETARTGRGTTHDGRRIGYRTPGRRRHAACL